MEPVPQLRINVFDPLSIQLGDRPPLDERCHRQKAKALFIYLYINRARSSSKYELLAELWPEAEMAEPGRVKHTVQVLRSTLEGPRPPGGWRVILEHGGRYHFNTAVERWSDVEEYESEVCAARRAWAGSSSGLARAHYQRALDLHRGGFLTDFRYEDWAAAEIGRQHELYLEVLEEAALVETCASNFQRAIELLRMATREDSLRESSYFELMHNLWLAGRRTDALRVYERLSEVLSQEMDLRPQAQTRRLYDAIRRDQAKVA